MNVWVHAGALRNPPVSAVDSTASVCTVCPGHVKGVSVFSACLYGTCCRPHDTADQHPQLSNRLRAAGTPLINACQHMQGVFNAPSCTPAKCEATTTNQEAAAAMLLCCPAIGLGCAAGPRHRSKVQGAGSQGPRSQVQGPGSKAQVLGPRSKAQVDGTGPTSTSAVQVLSLGTPHRVHSAKQSPSPAGPPASPAGAVAAARSTLPSKCHRLLRDHLARQLLRQALLLLPGR